MNKPSAKGWCPSTLIPMKSGDGLLIRIKPPFSRLTSRQAQKIAILSERYGNGFLDITNRANLQIRGLSQNTYPLMLKGLQNIGISGKNEVPDRINLVLGPFIPLAVIGFWFGLDAIPFVIFLSSAIALLLVMPDLIKKTKKMSTQIPFGPYIIVGNLIFLLLEKQLQFFIL